MSLSGDLNLEADPTLSAVPGGLAMDADLARFDGTAAPLFGNAELPRAILEGSAGDPDDLAGPFQVHRERVRGDRLLAQAFTLTINDAEQRGFGPNAIPRSTLGAPFSLFGAHREAARRMFGEPGAVEQEGRPLGGGENVLSAQDQGSARSQRYFTDPRIPDAATRDALVNEFRRREEDRQRRMRDLPGNLQQAARVPYDVLRQAFGGAEDAGRNALLAAAHGLGWLDGWIRRNVTDARLPNIGIDALDHPLDAITRALARPLIGPAETETGAQVRAITAFLVGFIPALRAMRVVGVAAGAESAVAAGALTASEIGMAPLAAMRFGPAAVGRITETSAAAALAEFLVRDPAEPNLANLIRDVPIVGELATSPHDLELINRTRNASAAAGANALLEPLVIAMQARAAIRRANDEVSRVVSQSTDAHPQRPTAAGAPEPQQPRPSEIGPPEGLVLPRNTSRASPEVAAGPAESNAAVRTRQLPRGELRYTGPGENAFVRFTDGSTESGRITEAVAAIVRAERNRDFQPGIVRLNRGRDDRVLHRGFGELHAEGKHGDSIRAFRLDGQQVYDDAAELIADVTANYNRVAMGSNGRLILGIVNGHDRIAVVDLARVGDGFVIVTAGIRNRGWMENPRRALPWGRTEPSTPQAPSTPGSQGSDVNIGIRQTRVNGAQERNSTSDRIVARAARTIPAGEERFTGAGPEALVRFSDGSTAFGQVTADVASAAREAGLDGFAQAGPIRLRRGWDDPEIRARNRAEGRTGPAAADDGEGFVHIEVCHGDDIRKFRDTVDGRIYADAADLVADVAANYNRIAPGHPGSGRLILGRVNGREPIAIIEIAPDGDGYIVRTAGFRSRGWMERQGALPWRPADSPAPLGRLSPSAQGSDVNIGTRQTRVNGAQERNSTSDRGEERLPRETYDTVVSEGVDRHVILSTDVPRGQSARIINDSAETIQRGGAFRHGLDSRLERMGSGANEGVGPETRPIAGGASGTRAAGARTGSQEQEGVDQSANSQAGRRDVDGAEQSLRDLGPPAALGGARTEALRANREREEQGDRTSSAGRSPDLSASPAAETQLRDFSAPRPSHLLTVLPAQAAGAERMGLPRLRSDGNEPSAGEASAALYGVVSALRDLVGLAAAGEGASSVRLDQPRAGGIDLAQTGPLGAIVDFIAHVRAPGAARDGAASLAAFNTRAALHAEAYRRAVGEGLSGDALAARVSEIVANPPAHIRLRAGEQSETRALLDVSSDYVRRLVRLRNARGADDAQPFDPLLLTLPLLARPEEMLEYGFTRPPLSLYAARLRDDLAAGGARRDLARAQLGMGGAVMLLAGNAAADGQITGAVPADGAPAHSMRIGDQWQSYDPRDPVGRVLAFAADLQAGAARGEIEPEDMDEWRGLIASGALAATQLTRQRGPFQTVVRTLALLSGQTGAPEQLAQAAPFARTIAPLGQDADPLLGAERRLGELSGRLLARRTLWGETGASAQPIDAELAALDHAPQRIRRQTVLAGVTVDLRPHPAVYEEYVRRAGNALSIPAFGGLGLRDYLNAVVTGAGGNDATRAAHTRYAALRDEGERVQFIEAAITRARAAAGQSILDDPRFAAFRRTWEVLRLRQAPAQSMREPMRRAVGGLGR